VRARRCGNGGGGWSRSRCGRGRGYIPLAINAEHARGASSAIGFNADAGVQATGADFSGRRSGGVDGKRRHRSAFCLRVVSRSVHGTRCHRALSTNCPVRCIDFPNLGRKCIGADGLACGFPETCRELQVNPREPKRTAQNHLNRPGEMPLVGRFAKKRHRPPGFLPCRQLHKLPHIKSRKSLVANTS
jgi:hypothetical protein